MLICVMRHGVAEELDPIRAGNDAQRELTPEGRRKTRQIARGMTRLGLEFGSILTSPRARAKQTAEIVADELGVLNGNVREVAALEPGSAFADILKTLADEPPTSDVLLVGHEPYLSGLISYLLTGDGDHVNVLMKKAALCGLDVGAIPPRHPATLRFLMQPKQLRTLDA